MNSLATLTFPSTAVESLRLYPLFLLFQNLHFLAPVEPDPAADPGESADSFIKWGFCQVHTPRPLGRERQRFLRLLADITSRGPDYAAQLKSLTLAASTERTPEESERSITRSLRGEDIPAPQEPQGEDLLWKARLLLAIGQLLDQEEEDLALSLTTFADEEKKLFKELQGDEDDEEMAALLGNLSRLEVERRGHSLYSQRQRFQAWKSLYATLPEGDFAMLLARPGDSGELLGEEYETKSGGEARLVMTLPLPTVVGLSRGEAEEEVRRFVDEAEPTLDRLAAHCEALLHLDPALAATAPPPLDEGLRTAWQELLDRHFPEERYGRSPVSFTLFPGWPTAALLCRPRQAATGHANGLLVTPL